MVVTEFVSPIVDFKTVTYKKDRSNYVLTLTFPDVPDDGITDKRKVLFLDTLTLLPSRIEDYLKFYDVEQKKVLEITNYKINAKDFPSDLFISPNSRIELTKVKAKEANATHSMVGTPPPDLPITAFNGESFNLKKFAGKVILLDFWEVWCSPCVGSISEIQKLCEQEKDLVVIGIISDKKNISLAKKILATHHGNYLNGVGNPAIAGLFEVNGYPTYAVIDRTGKIIYLEEGNFSKVKDLISKALK